MLPRVHTTPLFAGRSRTRVLETWREAASLVATGERLFVEAKAERRAWVSASDIAPVDAEEEAAAAELAAQSSSVAA